MPPAKTINLKSKDINVITKTLRKREITYSETKPLQHKLNGIASTSKVNSSLEGKKSNISPKCSHRRRINSRPIDSLKTCLPDISTKKRSKKISSLEDASSFNDISTERPKRVYRKKSLLPIYEVLGPRKRSKPVCKLGCCPISASSFSDIEDEIEEDDENDVDDEEFMPKKRSYRKQNYGISKNFRKPRKTSKSLCNLDSLSSSFVEIDIKGRRRLCWKKHSLHFEGKELIDDPTNSCPSSPASFLEIDIKQGKRIYRKKGFTEEDSFSAASPKNSSEVSTFHFSPVPKDFPSPKLDSDPPRKKRPYRRRMLRLSCSKPFEPIVSSPDLHEDNATSLPVVTTPKKRIPKVPHNTPVCVPRIVPSLEDISLPPIQKRGRGRPRKVREISDEEWTCASSTTLSIDTDLESQAAQCSQGSKLRRSRPWDFPDLQEEEEEPISEYELQRQRNIQENLQMLRQIFLESGLELNDKTCEETKAKKPYTRLPLPPPRPRSVRLEDRRSTGGLLDFSKFSRRISLD